jgi:hypothetical protein
MRRRYEGGLIVENGGNSSARRGGISEAVASTRLAQTSLKGLRAHRQHLRDEEEKVSYWRRLLHARIDILDAVSHAQGSLSLEELARVLGDASGRRTRSALARVRSAEVLPELPALSGMWVIEVDPHDGDAVAATMAKLRAAEQQVSAHRRALHRRIDEVSEELIARYRDNPGAALEALPH